MKGEEEAKLTDEEEGDKNAGTGKCFPFSSYSLYILVPSTFLLILRAYVDVHEICQHEHNSRKSSRSELTEK